MARMSLILAMLSLSLSLVFAQGSSPGNATSLPPNATSGASMSNTSTDHYWKVTIASNGYLRVQTTSDSGIDVDLTLFDANGTSSIMFDGRDSTYSEVYGFLRPGTYYVFARRWKGITGTYTITTSFVTPPRATDIDLNDTWSNAQALSTTGTATGNIGYFGSGNTDLDDYWKITTTEDGWLRVQITSDSLDARGDDYLDIDASLFDVNGTSSIMFDGRSGVFTQVSSFVRPGTYYVDVHKWHGRAGSYQIKSDFFTPPLTNDVEGNDTPSTATQAPINGTVTGHLGYFSNGTTDMDDYWKFTVPADGKVVVQVTSDSLDRSGAVFDLDLSIFDVNGTSNLIYDGEYGKFSQCILYLRPGTFYAQVHRWQGNGGSYTMKITHTPPSRANDLEGNDWFRYAAPLAYNVTSTGHMGYFAAGFTDYYDYWKLVATATDSVYVHVSSDTTVDLDLTAFGSDTTSSITTDGEYGIYSRVGIRATAGSTYYFRVNRWSGTAGSYSIIATRSSLAVGVEKNTDVAIIPRELVLEQNYPNPFNPSTFVQYGLPESERVRIIVFSLLGQEIAELTNAVQSPGIYRVVWNGKDRQGKGVPSGVYLIRLQAGTTQLVKKAMLVR
jgi:hypothetical protein